MQKEIYPYKAILPCIYKFVSKGKKRIVKIVEFTPTEYEDIVNLGFGDELPGKRVDDLSVTDNGDMVKVIATVISIIQTYTDEFPDHIILFSGSTVKRTKFYARILKNYYAEFSIGFHIYGFEIKGGTTFPVEFDPVNTGHYVGFFVKRK